MAPKSDVRRGLLLVGHGTRSPAGVTEFLQTAKLVADLLPDVHVEPAFLELARPTVAEAIQRVQAQNLVELVVVPLLLFAAGHAKQDIPQAVSATLPIERRFTLRQAEPLGCHPKILEAAAQRFAAAAGYDDQITLDETRLLLVGRGSSDPEAVAETRRFATLLAERCGVSQVETAFLAVAQPSLADRLRYLASFQIGRIIVQPHLLFAGELVSEIAAFVSEARAATPTKQWLLTSHLGPCKLVAETARDRFRACSGA